MSRGAPDGRRLARWGAWVAAALAAACTDASSPLNVVPLEPERIEPAAATADVRGPVGAAVDEDPAVLVRDRFGNPVPGVEVRFEVTEGGGTVVTPVDTTGADGRASTSWRLGTRVGPNTMRALVGADTITFAATGEPSFPSRITPLAGAGQADTVTHTLRDTLVVEVVDLYGNLTPEVTVSWNPSDATAAVTPVRAETDEVGRAYAVWTLGTRAGQHLVEVRAGTASSSFFVTVHAGAPVSLTVARGNGQTGAAGAALPAPLEALLVDEYGNGTPDRAVVWSVADGAGSFEADTTLTDVNGFAAARYLVGRTAGVMEQVTAAFAELPEATFSATTTDPDNLVIHWMYLTQAAQSNDNAVPLVAGRDALLRVFMLARATNAHRARVAVDFYHDGVLVRSDTLERSDDVVPATADESDLDASWNLLVPGSVVQPGLAVTVTADPADRVFESDETDNTFPGGALTPLDVRVLDDFRVTFVPIRVPNTNTVGRINEATKHVYALEAFRMFPMPGYDAVVREEYTSGVGGFGEIDQWRAALQEIRALKIAEGSSRYYYGLIGFSTPTAFCGFGYIPSRPDSTASFGASVGMDGPCGPSTAAHEWGHNWGRRHAPCGGPENPDPGYPYSSGTSGIWGVDVARMSLRPPTQYFDLMTYCGPEWISDYTFEAVVNFRDDEAALAAAAPPPAGPRQPSLIVWGRIEGDRLVLEPTFEATTVPNPPATSGPYRVEGLAADGSTLFSLSFAGDEVDHLPGERHFAFAVSLDQARPAVLDRVRLSAPASALQPAEMIRRDDLLAAPAGAPLLSVAAETEDAVRIDWNVDDYPLAVVRNASTGRILSFARGPSALVFSEASEIDVTLSPGIGGVGRRLRIR